MDNMLKYKGFYGSIEYSNTDNIYFGKVVEINSLISYEGKTISELEIDFQGAVDDYIELCSKNNK